MKKASVLIFLISQVTFCASADSGKPSVKRAMRVLNGFCAFVPSGAAVLGNDTVSVQSFFMSTTEVTNLQYAEFLSHLKKKGELEKLKIAQVDSACWTRSLNYGGPMAAYYHQHPAYFSYPVVGITKEGAALYCEWLTEVYDSLSGGEGKIIFRLPTQAEWVRAARGDEHNRVYAWESMGIRNEKGEVQANFLSFGSENITRNPETGQLEVNTNDWVGQSSDLDNFDIVAPTDSFWPNDFGMYNMNGNVSELLADGNLAAGGDWRSPGFDIRNESTTAVSGTEPTVGFRIVATYLSN